MQLQLGQLLEALWHEALKLGKPTQEEAWGLKLGKQVEVGGLKLGKPTQQEGGGLEVGALVVVVRRVAARHKTYVT